MKYNQDLYAMFAYEMMMGGYVITLENIEGSDEKVPSIYIPGVLEGRTPGRVPICCQKVSWAVFAKPEDLLSHLVGTYVEYISRYKSNDSLYNYGRYVRDVVLPNIYRKLTTNDDRMTSEAPFAKGKYITPEIDRLDDKHIIPCIKS